MELYLKKLKKMNLGMEPYVQLVEDNPHCGMNLKPIIRNWYFLGEDLLPRPGVDRSLII